MQIENNLSSQTVYLVRWGSLGYVPTAAAKGSAGGAIVIARVTAAAAVAASNVDSSPGTKLSSSAVGGTRLG